MQGFPGQPRPAASNRVLTIGPNEQGIVTATVSGHPVTSAATFIGPYRLINPVYFGATTQLWQAYHDATHRYIALKFLQEKFRTDREQIRSLRWEYQVASQFDDERIIKIYEFNIDKGIPYLAMEWFSGGNMKSLIRRGLPEYAHLVRKIIFQCIEGVSYLHRQGYVHRDIKPENFLVSNQGDVKLIDFALCRKMAPRILWYLRPKAKIQGTCSYMSPEQILNKPLDGRADLYSLACTIFELVCGKPPFTGQNQTELLNKHLKAAPPPPEAYNPNLTPEFSRILQKALAKRPADRFKTIGEFAGALYDVQIFKEPPVGEVTPEMVSV
ncbi:serine/threonine protein kinase [Thermogutta terrifontis]|uniref:Serine/threonine protein kinase n=1 Tax=Thermogutta terrifontis TaxID=1331910 RepID=A0A286REP9_9BACT|nr:serine/threonine protein kinase [Thermogutta terrifontis]